MTVAEIGELRRVSTNHRGVAAEVVGLHHTNQHDGDGVRVPFLRVQRQRPLDALIRGAELAQMPERQRPDHFARADRRSADMALELRVWTVKVVECDLRAVRARGEVAAEVLRPAGDHCRPREEQ